MKELTLQELYDKAKNHKENHKSCGGEPYKSFEKLFEIVSLYTKDKFNTNITEDFRVLEIGTAIGFTTYVLQKAISQSSNEKVKKIIDTIEYHMDHVCEAELNLEKWNINDSKGNENFKINFICGDAKDILPTLSTTPLNRYDIIFFDGYGAKDIFYNDFERILKPDGLLITANKHLKSTEQNYFDHFTNNQTWDFQQEFADTVVHKKKVL